jgi:hypothetical protein
MTDKNRMKDTGNCTSDEHDRQIALVPNLSSGGVCIFGKGIPLVSLIE